MRIVHSNALPLCPKCQYLMSGYDKRRRSVICDSGEKVVYILRRFRCPLCEAIHLEIPDCIAPKKHYAADVIKDTIDGTIDFCSADDSTMRRWKKNPPVLPR